MIKIKIKEIGIEIEVDFYWMRRKSGKWLLIQDKELNEISCEIMYRALLYFFLSQTFFLRISKLKLEYFPPLP